MIRRCVDECLEESNESIMMRRKVGRAVQRTIGLEIDTNIPCVTGVDVERNIVDRSGREYLDVTSYRTQGQGPVEQHDVDDRTERLHA